MPFCGPFYELLLEVRIYELQGEGSPNIILLSFVVCFATVLLHLMVSERNKSHMVHYSLRRPHLAFQAEAGLHRFICLLTLF